MEVVKRMPVRIHVEGRSAPVRVADAIVLRDSCAYFSAVEIKTEKYGTVMVPFEKLRGDVKHLFDEVNLEKEYN